MRPVPRRPTPGTALTDLNTALSGGAPVTTINDQDLDLDLDLDPDPDQPASGEDVYVGLTSTEMDADMEQAFKLHKQRERYV